VRHEENHDEQLRIPPQSAEAEQAVLGAIMLDNEALHRVSDLVNEASFYRRDHKLIFRAMRELADGDKSLDAVTLGEWFESHGLGEQIGGTGTLIDLASNTPSAANARAYAEIVREKYQLRRLIEAGTEAVNLGFHPDGETSETLIGRAASRIGEVLQVKDEAAVTVESALKQMWAGIMRRYESSSDLAGIPTGFSELDKLIGGWQKGRVYGIGARPKMGKSTLAENSVEHAAMRAGKNCAVWTMEMGSQEYMERMVCSYGNIRSGSVMHPKLMEDTEWSAMQAAIAALKEAPIIIFDNPELSIEMFEAQARVLKAKGMLDLAVIDYLGLMTMPDADTQTLSIAKITGRLKKIARKLDIPIVILFQLNRGNETGSIRPPRASDARDSGAIEQDLDCMIMLHKPTAYDKDAQSGVRVEVVIQRNGPTGVIRLEDRLDRFQLVQSSDEWVDQRGPSGGGRGGKQQKQEDPYRAGF